MSRALPKKSPQRRAKAVVPAGRILEMKPVAENRLRPGLTPGLVILLLVAIGSIAVAAFAFQKLAVVVGYADKTANQLAAVQQQAADLKERVDNFETLRLLAQKTAVPTTPATPPADLVWLDYASKNLSLKYPQGYTLLKASSAYPALVIKNDSARIEIFRQNDFPGGIRPDGCSTSSGYSIDQPELGKPLPMECLTVAPVPANAKIVPYDVWIYYSTDDKVTKAILEQLASTIKVLR